jgi:hypothetical protein
MIADVAFGSMMAHNVGQQAIAAEWRIRLVLKAKVFGRHRLNRVVTA